MTITGYDVVSCLGDAEQTFAALLSGAVGVSPLRPDRADPVRFGVANAYQIDQQAQQLQASGWLATAIASAVLRAGLDPVAKRTAVVVGTGLRELPSVERWHADDAELRLHELHFGAAVRSVLPTATEVVTISNACSAAGSALALACDLLAADEADAVVVAGCDGMTRSMLSIVGRGSPVATAAVRPFDLDREGVLLGEGAAAVVVERAGSAAEPLAVVRGVGLSCDAYHETAPSRAGIVASMHDAHRLAGLTPDQIDLVLAHGTGTALNDPTEAGALAEVFGDALERTTVTGIKASVGHTSGSAFLMSLIVAIQALRQGTVPPIAGLRTTIDEAADLRLVRGEAEPIDGSIAQVNAFGFGGVNAVAILEVAS
ncbi:beta-ketoacyl synthase N-terminal-like domain-containing protein [Kitasatospora sp. P5_F3]